MPVFIEIADERQTHAPDHARIRQAVHLILAEAGIHAGEISIAVIDDARMQELNKQYLQHDYPTDVLSFVLEQDAEQKTLDGEIIVSAEYAAREAVRYAWSPEDELLLYVIHGCLHLIGHDDATGEGQAAMRAAESRVLKEFGLAHRFDAP